MKKQKTIVIALLISLLLISAIALLSANLVSASVGAANFLPNNFQSGIDTQNEVTLSRNTAQYITTALANFNYPYGCYYSYDTDCTVSRYDSILSTMQNNYNQIIVFSKGHRGTPYYLDNPPNWNHSSIIDNVGNNVIDATDIYSRTSISKNVVTFIWHCETALHYTPGTIPHDTRGYYSMPYTWTHNQNLNCYGTSGSQVFLGWTNVVPGPPYPQQAGGSPQYEYSINPNYNYANVAGMFWYYTTSGYTISQALNQIASTIYGQGNFNQTPLYGWLVAYGNINLNLP